MKGFTQAKGRTVSTVLGLAILAGLGLGASQAFAGGGGSAKAPIRPHASNCADPSDNKVIGIAKFVRSGNTVTVRVSIHGGTPGTYYLYLYFNFCSDSGYSTKFKVDASGDGSRSLTATVPSSARFFFADAYNATTDTDNESDVVTL